MARKQVDHVCPICEKPFRAEATRRFCGNPCSSVARQRARRASWFKEHYDKQGRRLCHSCGRFKPTDKFYVDRSRPDDLALNCADCARAKQEAIRTAPGGKDRIAAQHRQRTYGLSEKAYQKILKRQGGGCATCGSKTKKLHVDHDHATGKVRGLLCGPCNRAIGLIYDSPKIARKIVKYLVA